MEIIRGLSVARFVLLMGGQGRWNWPGTSPCSYTLGRIASRPVTRCYA